MADPQAATDAPANAAPNIVGMVGDITDDDKKRDAALKAYEATYTGEQKAISGMLGAEQHRSDDLTSRQEQILAREGASADELKPWNAQQELSQHQTSLWEKFGSPGFVIGMLASAFTGMPMVSALNAGAASMNAINQGDMNAYNKAFEAYKFNTDLMIKRSSLEEKEFSQIEDLKKTNMAEWATRAKMLLLRFNDQRKLSLLEAGLFPEFDNAQAAEWAKRDEIIKMLPDSIVSHGMINKLNGLPVTDENKIAALNQMPKAQSAAVGYHKDNKGNWLQGGDPRYWSGDAQQQWQAIKEAAEEANQVKYAGRYGALTIGRENAQTVADVKAQLHKKHPEWDDAKVDTEANKIIAASKASPITGNKRADLERHIGLYDDAIKIIDQVTDTLNKYVGAAGIPGRAMRLGERLRDIAGSHDTDRVQMMRDISQLQFMATTLLLDRTGRPLSAEHEDVESIIAGLNAGDTNANTLRAMREIRDRLLAIRNRDNTAIGEGEPGTAPQAPDKTPTHDWNDFPAVR